MYRVIYAYVMAMYIMDIDFFRLAISFNKCLENYAMHTERINGGNISANIVVNGSSLFVDFFVVVKISIS